MPGVTSPAPVATTVGGGAPTPYRPRADDDAPSVGAVTAPVADGRE